MTNSATNAFLVVRTDFLGDSVLSSTFIQSITQLADVKVDVLCVDYNYAAFKFNPNIRNTYCLSKASGTLLRGNEDILHEIKQNFYTAVFVLNRDLKTYAVLKHVQTNKIFGHRLGVKSMRSKMFCNITEIRGKYNYLPYYDNTHEVRNQFDLLCFGINHLGIKHQLELAKRSYFYTDKFNPLQAAAKDSNKVVMNISGRQDALKYIPISLARCIIEDLLQQNKQVLLVATHDDADRAKELCELFPQTQVQLLVEADLFRLADSISHAEYFIGADGGLLHIASGLGMSCIGLFNAQNMSSWHPWCEKQICLQAPTKRLYDLTPAQIMTAFRSVNAN